MIAEHGQAPASEPCRRDRLPAQAGRTGAYDRGADPTVGVAGKHSHPVGLDQPGYPHVLSRDEPTAARRKCGASGDLLNAAAAVTLGRGDTHEVSSGQPG